MQRVWKRIAVHGLLTALVLGVVGAAFAELASLWLMSAAPSRPDAQGLPAKDSLPSAVRTRVPLAMAGLGFAFVAVGELVWFAVRGAKKPAPPPKPPEPDTAVLLLEELLKQADVALEKEKQASRNPPPLPDVHHEGSILTPDP